MERIKAVLRHWIPLAVVITALCGLVYLAVQQELRQAANDPQIQMAEDAAAALEGGAPVESVIPSETVAIERSLAPFVTVFDDSGGVAASSARLHGAVPELPAGVLEYARNHGEDRITWQPEEGVRIAAVIVRYRGSASGFVLAGRSLREVEVREDNALLEAAAAGIAALGASLIAVILVEFIFGARKAKPSVG
jgi:hypothetical protein